MFVYWVPTVFGTISVPRTIVLCIIYFNATIKKIHCIVRVWADDISSYNRVECLLFVRSPYTRKL